MLAALAVVATGVVGADAGKPLTPQITIEYTAPTTATVIGTPTDHVARMQVLVNAVEAQLRLPQTLKILYRECGSANAYYWRSTRTIEICHELWDKRRALYRRSGLDRETADRRLHNSMMFTVFHELGHVMHEQLKLPLLGNEEDAVDDIATLWMIRLGVGESAKSAAYGHHLRALQPQYDNAPWDEHNNGARRGFAIACLLYGSDPDHYIHVFKQMNVPAPHIARCTADYTERLAAWQTLLGPHLAR